MGKGEELITVSSHTDGLPRDLLLGRQTHHD